MSKERDLLRKLFEAGLLDRLLAIEVGQLLAQPEQTEQEHNIKKKEPVIYFVKNKFGELIPTFKNPKGSFFWIDVQHGGG